MPATRKDDWGTKLDLEFLSRLLPPFVQRWLRPLDELPGEHPQSGDSSEDSVTKRFEEEEMAHQEMQRDARWEG